MESQSIDEVTSGTDDVGSMDFVTSSGDSTDTANMESSGDVAIKIETVFSLADDIGHINGQKVDEKTNAPEIDTQKSDDLLQDKEKGDLDKHENEKDVENDGWVTEETKDGINPKYTTFTPDDMVPVIKTEPLSPPAEEFQEELPFQKDIKIKVEPPDEFCTEGDTAKHRTHCSESAPTDRRPNRKRKPNQIYSDSYILSYKGNSLLRDVTVTLDDAKNAQKRSKSSEDSNQSSETDSKASSIKSSTKHSKSIKSEKFEFEQVDQSGYSRTCLPEVMLRNRMDVLAASVKRKKNYMYKELTKEPEGTVKKRSRKKSVDPVPNMTKVNKSGDSVSTDEKDKRFGNSVKKGNGALNDKKDQVGGVNSIPPKPAENSAFMQSLNSKLPANTASNPNLLSPLFSVLEKPSVNKGHSAQTAILRRTPIATNNSKKIIMVPDGKSTVPQAKNYNETVKELAKLQNTKKFFQLVIGSKIVLIPTNEDVIVPKAYVVDMLKDKTTANLILNGGKKITTPSATTVSGQKDPDNLLPPVLYPQAQVDADKTVSPECSPPTLHPEVVLSTTQNAKSNKFNNQLPNIVSKYNKSTAKCPDKNLPNLASDTSRMTEKPDQGCLNNETLASTKTEDVSERIRKLREKLNAQQRDVENARKSIEKIKNANIVDT